MPAAAQTFDKPTLTANPTVSKVCSRAVLLRSRQIQTLRLPVGIWLAELLPPSEASFDTGSRTYRCLAEELERQPSSSQFTR